MSTRGAGRHSWRGRRTTLAALAIVAAGSLAACGSEDFTNEPRSAAEINVGARIDSKKVVVSPSRFGAGLVTFSIANFSRSPVRFELSGPKDGSTAEIPPNAPGSLEITLPEGDYQVTAGQDATAQPATITVGPKRASSDSKLLLP